MDSTNKMDLKRYKIFYGWWIVGAIILITAYAGGIVVSGFTAIFEPIANEFHWSYAQVSLAASIRGLEGSFLSPLVGFLFDRWGPRRLTLWPPPFPEAVPEAFCETAADEFKVNKVFLERARQTRKSFVSLIWHPWSLHRFDPEMKMLELTFAHVRRVGLEPCTYAQL